MPTRSRISKELREKLLRDNEIRYACEVYSDLMSKPISLSLTIGQIEQYAFMFGKYLGTSETKKFIKKIGEDLTSYTSIGKE